MKNDDNKMILLELLLTVFKEETDKDHPAKLNKLGLRVSEKAHKSKPLDSRTIASYIKILQRLGFGIDKKTGGYYLEKRFLDRSEVKLLCDQITFSSIMPRDRKKKIIDGLISDLSMNDQKLLKSNISLEYKSQLENYIYKDTLNNANIILEAIENDKKITFKYGDYDENKKIQLKDKVYRVSPFEFVYEQGKYYIMCQNQNEEDNGITRNYRIDLMKEIKVTNTKRCSYPFEENITEYCIKQLNMYATDNQKIVLEVDGSGLRGLYDKLGLDSNIKVTKTNNNKYRAEFEASLQGTFYFVLQYLEHMTVVKPVKLKNEVKNCLKKSLEKYID